MEVRICGDWILRIPEIPYLERRVLVIVIGHQELSWDLRVPDHGGFSQDGSFLSIASLSSEVIVVILLGGVLARFGESEDRFARLEVPHDDLSIFASRG